MASLRESPGEGVPRDNDGLTAKPANAPAAQGLVLRALGPSPGAEPSVAGSSVGSPHPSPRRLHSGSESQSCDPP